MKKQEILSILEEVGIFVVPEEADEETDNAINELLEEVCEWSAEYDDAIVLKEN